MDLPYLKDGLIYSRKNWASRRLIIPDGLSVAGEWVVSSGL